MDVKLMLDGEEIESYLSGSIILWREKLEGDDEKFKKIAPYYIDAFQSVRVTLFGDILPEEGNDEN